MSLSATTGLQTSCPVLELQNYSVVEKCTCQNGHLRFPQDFSTVSYLFRWRSCFRGSAGWLYAAQTRVRRETKSQTQQQQPSQVCLIVRCIVNYCILRFLKFKLRSELCSFERIQSISCCFQIRRGILWLLTHVSNVLSQCVTCHTFLRSYVTRHNFLRYVTISSLPVQAARLRASGDGRGPMPRHLVRNTKRKMSCPSVFKQLHCHFSPKFETSYNIHITHMVLHISFA